jgi:hypothetical protein
MKKLLLPGLLCAVFLLSGKVSIGQKNSDSLVQKNSDSLAQKSPDTLAQKNPDSLARKIPDYDIFPKKSYWQVGINYLSDNVYLGRKDSVKIPYISPSIAYYDKSGFYVNGSLSFLPASGNSHIDLVTLEAGYSFTVNDFEGQIAADKFFYNSKSTNVRSEVKGGLNSMLGYNFGFIKPTVQGGISFGKSTDYSLALGLEHTFYLVDDKIDITPQGLANFSTQNFYGSYYNRRRYTGKRKRKSTGILYYDISADVSNVSKFKLLDYEFSAPINYTCGKWVFNFTPTIAIPENPAEVTLHFQPSTGLPFSRTFREKLGESFFFQAGITYQL